MLPKKEPPLVRAETICCIAAALIAAGCLVHHPESDLPLAAILVLMIAANVLQYLRDRKDRNARK